MLYDALVQRRFSALSSTPPTSPLFGLSGRLVDAMLVFTDPLPLHFGNASALLCNIRVDAHPRENLAALAEATAYMDSAYVGYARERAAYLRGNPGAPGAGEARALESVRGLDARDLTPVFNFCACRTAMDRPILCLVLAQLWVRQTGGVGGREGDRQARALEAFAGCCEWAAAVHIPK